MSMVQESKSPFKAVETPICSGQPGTAVTTSSNDQQDKCSADLSERETSGRI